jgi:hypothetical protein
MDSQNLLDQLVSAGEQRGRHGQPQRFCGLQVERQFELGRLDNRQIGRFLTLQDARHVGSGSTKGVVDAGRITDEAARRNKLARISVNLRLVSGENLLR